MTICVVERGVESEKIFYIQKMTFQKMTGCTSNLCSDKVLPGVLSFYCMGKL